MPRLREVCAALLALTLLLAGTANSPAAAAEKSTLRVYAAASLVDAFNELGKQLEHQRPGLDVHMSFAGSQQLASQLEQGAPADVFASADERWMEEIDDRGLLAADAVRFVQNKMVVIVPGTNPARITKLQDLARGGVKLLLCADAVPAGHYSRIVLKNLATDPAYGSDYALKVLRNLVSEEENVRSVVAKIQLGEADAGFVYRSDVNANLKRYVKVIDIPAAANVLAAYPIAPLKTAADPAAARAFIDLVRSDAGQKVLERYGFMSVTAHAQ